MSRNNRLEFVRMVGAQLDDQAISEIASVLRLGTGGPDVSPTDLLQLAAAGPLIVARRPCGAEPEIVGVAGLKLGPNPGDIGEVIAVDTAYADQGVEAALRACLQAQSPRVSLFRGRDRAPFGLVRGAVAS